MKSPHSDGTEMCWTRPNVCQNRFIQIFTNLSHHLAHIYIYISDECSICALFTLTVSGITWICNAFINILRYIDVCCVDARHLSNADWCCCGGFHSIRCRYGHKNNIIFRIAKIYMISIWNQRSCGHRRRHRCRLLIFCQWIFSVSHTSIICRQSLIVVNMTHWKAEAWACTNSVLSKIKYRISYPIHGCYWRSTCSPHT